MSSPPSSSSLRGLPPATRNLAPSRAGRSTTQEKASAYLLISLICAGPTCLFTFFMLFGGLILHDGFPTCHAGFRGHVICGIVFVPPILSFLSFVFDFVLLSKLNKLAKSVTAGVLTARVGPPREGEEVNDTTPLLGRGCATSAPGSPRDPSTSHQIPFSYPIWTWIFAALWAVLSLHVLINVVYQVAPGTTWAPSDTWNWCLLAPLHLLQLWMLSITALLLSKPGSDDAAQSSVAEPPLRVSPVAVTQSQLIISFDLLPLSLVLSEAQLPFLRLFLLTLTFDVTALFTMDVHAVLQPSKPIPVSGALQPAPRAHFTPSRRIFFGVISAATFVLSLLWAVWSTLTLITATLSLLRDVFPDWDIVRLPIPERGWAAWVWLEAVVDIWQGWTLGRVGVASWKAASDRVHL